jgi:hypothetical protein
MDREQRREADPEDAGDLVFLERVFHKLMLNFTWWVNRKDAQGLNIFQGGFLGLDNIGVFDRSAPLPTGGFINQADGTAWMAMYSLNLMRIALELATHNKVYEDIATKFFEHFLGIVEAMNNIGDEGIGLWDEEDELRQKFCYPGGGVMVGKLIRCAKSDCYRGRNGQKHEPEDTEGSIGKDETAVSNRRNAVQEKAIGSSPGAFWVSSQSGHPGAAGAPGRVWATDSNGPACGVRAEQIATLVAADLGGHRLRVRDSTGGHDARMGARI